MCVSMCSVCVFATTHTCMSIHILTINCMRWWMLARAGRYSKAKRDYREPTHTHTHTPPTLNAACYTNTLYMKSSSTITIDEFNLTTKALILLLSHPPSLSSTLPLIHPPSGPPPSRSPPSLWSPWPLPSACRLA